MIYTVTFNPAIDYVVKTDKMKSGEVNRANEEKMYFGGKGINVSLVLRELGIKSRAFGFIAGFTGEAIENGLASQGIETGFVRLKNGFSRINVKIKSDEETELNGRGPDIPDDAVKELFEKLEMIKDGDTLVLAGSIPPSLPSDIYEKILAHLEGRKIKTVVDATKDLLLNVLKYRPFLVKPNNHELGEMFGVKLETVEQIAEYAEKLRKMGAENVLVSMAGDGALLIDETGKVYHQGVCKGTVKNSVGAGDSMVAGFIAGAEKGDYEYALKLGTACGGATAFSDGLAEKEDIFRLLGTI
ncbi:MAG: 1-phosphofructokinase [Oscillospiraceae bacterium]|nr:1-phosphofructokinase [Oscillospiraceae bacterium]